MEAYIFSTDDRFDVNVAYELRVPSNAIFQLSDFILKKYQDYDNENYNYLTNNCVTFVVDVWNSIAPPDDMLAVDPLLIFIDTPNELKEAMDEKFSGRDMYHYNISIPEMFSCYYWNGSQLIGTSWR